MCSSTKRVNFAPIFRCNFKCTEYHILLFVADDMTFTCHILRSMMSTKLSQQRFWALRLTRFFITSISKIPQLICEFQVRIPLLWSGLKEKSIHLKHIFTFQCGVLL